MSPEFQSPNPEQYALEILSKTKEALNFAVEVVSPDTPDVDPLAIFPAAGERRADDIGLALSPDQEHALRGVAAELGFGRESNRTMTELGLSGGHAVIEGGQAHKMLAEALVVVNDCFAAPKSIIISATPFRAIPPAEKTITSQILDIDLDDVGNSEYEVAKQVVNKIPGFIQQNEETLPFSYDIHNDYAVSNEPNGQFTALGNIHGIPVVLLRIDRENYLNEEGKTAYRLQPDTAQVIAIVDRVLKIQDDPETPIAFVSSGTYQPSRDIDGARAALLTRRKVGIPTYGTALLAEVKGEDLPAPGPITQLPGEFNKVALQIAKLEKILDIRR
jgi:hypothetical protein